MKNVKQGTNKLELKLLKCFWNLKIMKH